KNAEHQLACPVGRLICPRELLSLRAAQGRFNPSHDWVSLRCVPNVPDGPAGSTLGTYADQAGKSRAPARAVQPGTTATGRGEGCHRAVAGNAAGARAERRAAKTCGPPRPSPRDSGLTRNPGRGGTVYKMTPLRRLPRER